MTPPVVLITGATSGIGHASAARFAQAGYITYGTARRREAFASISAVGALPLCLDMRDEDSLINAVQTIEAQHGGVTILVNNAGYGQFGVLEEMPLAVLRQQFETNVFGLLRLTQLVLPSMRQHQAGRIINISSAGGEFTTPGSGAYHMSKYALESLTEALRFEVKPFGIQVISIQPGGVATEFITNSEGQTALSQADSPYYAFQQAVINRTRALFEDNSNAGILTPQQVAQVIFQAAVTARPRTRYKVGLTAKAMPRLRHWMPDRLWDWTMARMFS